MHGKERDAKVRSALGRTSDCIADVVELEVEKDALSRADEVGCEWKTARHDELVTDFVEGNRVPEPNDRAFGLVQAREVKGDDQPVASRCSQWRLNVRIRRMR